jgi:hypothetical protein
MYRQICTLVHTSTHTYTCPRVYHGMWLRACIEKIRIFALIFVTISGLGHCSMAETMTDDAPLEAGEDTLADLARLRSALVALRTVVATHLAVVHGDESKAKPCTTSSSALFSQDELLLEEDALEEVERLRKELSMLRDAAAKHLFVVDTTNVDVSIPAPARGAA